MANTLYKYGNQYPTWDAQDLGVDIDGVPIDTFAYSGNKYSYTLAEDRNKVSTNVDGKHIRLFAHNKSGTLTVNISRASDSWQNLIADDETFFQKEHIINCYSPVEHVSTTSAYLSKQAEAPGDGQTAPDAGLVFNCGEINIEHR